MRSSGKAIKLSKIFDLEFATALFLAYNNIMAAANWITDDKLISANEMIRYLAILYFFMALGCELLVRKNSIPCDILFVFGVFLFLYLVSMLNANTYHIIVSQGLLLNTFLEGLSLYAALRLIQNKNKLWHEIVVVSWVVLILYSYSFFVYNVGDTNNYRTFSSGLILVAGVFLTNWLYSNDKKYILPSILSVVFIATCGRRSSLVSLAIIIAVILLLKKDYKKLFACMIILAGLALFWKSLIFLLYDICVGFGVRPRILVRILAGTIEDDSHRFEQWSYVFYLVNQSVKNFFLGLGVAGERYYMLSHFQHMKIYGYPHCILVEMIGHFGMLFGPLIELFLFVVGPIRTFRNNIHDDEYIKLFLFGISIASALLFQDSYLQNKFFFSIWRLLLRI